MFCFLIYELFSLFVINTSLYIDFEQILLFCFIIYMFFSLFNINTNLNINFIIFNIELAISILKNVNIKSYVTSLKKNKLVIV